jgi:hypothetical protein
MRISINLAARTTPASNEKEVGAIDPALALA